MDVPVCIGNTCGFDKPLGMHILCGDFYFGRAKKQIVPNHDDGGWEFVGFLPREMPWASREAARVRGQFVIDHSGDPYVYSEICPLCGGELLGVEVRPRLPSGEPTGDGEL